MIRPGQSQTLLIFQADATAVSTITTTTQAIEDTLTLIAATTLQREQMIRPGQSQTLLVFQADYSGFNYHNNNPGNRRYVNSN